jgi:nitrogen regulatory protein PII
VSFVPKIQIEVLCETGQRDDIVQAISKTASTGTIGDGKIWITPVENVMRIRTGEVGEDAI